MKDIQLTTALGGKIKIWQPLKGYRCAIDPILMAAFVPEKCTHILELGIGGGMASLSLAYRLPQVHITGIDIQSENIELAIKNCNENAFSDRFKLIVGDFKNKQLPGHHFDCVMMNPPYYDAEEYLSSPSIHKTISHGENGTPLNQWINEAYRCLKSNGYIVIVHKTDRLDDLLTFLHVKYGQIEVYPLWPKEGRVSKRVLIRARKSSKTPTKLYPGLVLHESDGSYTSKAKDILENGMGIIRTNEVRS